MKRLLLLIIIACFYSSKIIAQTPKLISVTITFRTSGDNKDPDTKLYVDVKNKENLFLSQNIASGSNLGDKKEFIDPSNESFNLPPATQNLTLSSFKAPYLSISILPKGDDAWTFDYVLQFDFDDGTKYSTEGHNITLDQDNRHYCKIFLN